MSSEVMETELCVQVCVRVHVCEFIQGGMVCTIGKSPATPRNE